MSDNDTMAFLGGKPAPEDFREVFAHVSPLKTYYVVFGALLVLTALTYAVSFLDLGGASLFVAMVVAVTKATLVCMYFMHLKYDDKFNIFVFVSSILFVGIFFTFTIFDLSSRPNLNDEQRTFFRADHGVGFGYQPPEKPEGVPAVPAGD